MNIEKIISQASEYVKAQEYHEAIKLLQNLKPTNNVHQFQINYLKAIELSENVNLHKDLRKKLTKSVYEDDNFSAKLFC